MAGKPSQKSPARLPSGTQPNFTGRRFYHLACGRRFCVGCLKAVWLEFECLPRLLQNRHPGLIFLWMPASRDQPSPHTGALGFGSAENLPKALLVESTGCGPMAFRHTGLGSTIKGPRSSRGHPGRGKSAGREPVPGHITELPFFNGVSKCHQLQNNFNICAKAAFRKASVS